MGRTPREAMKIQQRRQQVAELYLQGNTQASIAQQLVVSQATVSNDLKMVRREWKESRIRDFDEAVGQELQKLLLLEREAWIGWRRSQEPLETSKVVQQGSEKRAEKASRQQHGDPRYLELLQKVIAGRRALLGLDAPTRIAPTNPEGDEAYEVHVMQKLLNLAEETQASPTIIDAEYIERKLQSAQAADVNKPESLPLESDEKSND